MNTLDCDVSRRIEIAIKLVEHQQNSLFDTFICKSKSILSNLKRFFHNSMAQYSVNEVKVKRWKTLYEIWNVVGKDGNTRKIVKEFYDTRLIIKDDMGYFFDVNKAKNMYRESIYASFAKSLGLGDIFA